MSTSRREHAAQADANGDSAKRAQTGQQANASAERDTSNHTPPPRPPPLPPAPEANMTKWKCAERQKHFIRVSFGHALDLRSCSPHWTCFRWHSALLFRVVRDTPCFTLDLFSWHSAFFHTLLSRMELALVRHAPWTTHWVNTLCWLTLLDSTSDQRAADTGLVYAAFVSLPRHTRKDREKPCRFSSAAALAHRALWVTDALLTRTGSTSRACVVFSQALRREWTKILSLRLVPPSSETCSGCSPSFQQC